MKKYFQRQFKIFNFFKNNFKKIKLKLKKSKIRKTRESLIKKLIKNQKYLNLINKINNFKKEEGLIKTPKKKKKSSSFMNRLTETKKYQKFLNHIRNIKDINLKIIPKFNFNNDNYKFFKNNNILEQVKNPFEKIKIYKSFKDNLNSNKIKKNAKHDQKIGIIFYTDHNLTFVSMKINLNNKINITGVTEIPIPANVIGDSLVEDINELANIVLDSLNLLDLTDSPLLVILSSSFFNIHTFLASDLKQISQSDKKVQSKSPYLPANTFVEFLKISDNKLSESQVRSCYTKKDLIDSWTDTLQIIDQPVIGLVPAAPLIFDLITSVVFQKTTILIDIEATSTTLLLGRNKANLTSYKLPFGYSLYISNTLDESSTNYFERVLNSTKIILNENNDLLPENIFVMGLGLDKLVNDKSTLPKGFKSISSLKLSEYSYFPKKLEIHELLSDSINSNICSLASILSSCV